MEALCVQPPLFFSILANAIVDFQNTQGIIYVVDSNDVDRADEAREELQRLLADPELQGSPLLVWSNKQDLPNALTAAQLTDKLGLNGVRDRKWYIQVSARSSSPHYKH